MASKTMGILSSLMKSRNGLTASQIFEMIEDYESKRGLRSFLCMMVKRGLVRIDGKIQCVHCMAAASCYRITDEGRIYLNHRINRNTMETV